MKHKDKTYPGEHEAIIEKKLWDEVHEILGENSKARGNKSRSKNPALLSGIIRCGHCGTSMGMTFTRKGSRTYRYYLCGKARKHSYDVCPVKTLPAADIEETVIDQLRAVFRSPELVAATVKNVCELERKEIEKLEQERKDIEQHIQIQHSSATRLLQSSAESDQPISYIQDELSKLDEETQTAGRQLRMIEAELTFHQERPSGVSEVLSELSVLDNLWEHLFPPERERILRLLIETVLVFTDRIEIVLRGGGLNAVGSELKPEEEGDRDHGQPQH